MIEKKSPTHEEDGWKGYTLDELRYQRAVALARIEMEREKMAVKAYDLRQNMPVVGRSGLMGKIMGSLSYVDYIVLAFKLTRSLSRIFRRRR